MSLCLASLQLYKYNEQILNTKYVIWILDLTSCQERSPITTSTLSFQRHVMDVGLSNKYISRVCVKKSCHELIGFLYLIVIDNRCQKINLRLSIFV